MAEVEIVPTKHGLSDAKAFTEQPPMTTALSLNMRTQQASTGRLRIAKRAGYRKFNSRPLTSNLLAFTEDLGHFRDTLEGDQPFPQREGWIVGVTGAASFSAQTDTTLAPDGVGLAQLAKQLAASGSLRTEIAQHLDVLDPATVITARSGATALRTAGKDLLFSIFLKASDATTNILTIRQGLSAGQPRTSYTITWTAGVPTIGSIVTDGPGSHPTGFTFEGDGWYRFFLGITWNPGIEAVASVLRCIFVPNQTDTSVKGTYAWGAQLELVASGSSEATIYDPVTGKNDPLLKQRATGFTTLNFVENSSTFVRRDVPSIDRGIVTPGKSVARKIQIDRQGSRYILESQAVAKYTDTGTFVFTIPVPIDDPQHNCNALAVSSVDDVFVGVTSGGDAGKAKLFCFAQGPEVQAGVLNENAFHLRWSVLTKRYVTDIKERDGLLYTTQDDPVYRTSELVVYGQLGTVEPVEVLRRSLPYPTQACCVKSDGAVVTAAPTYLPRGLDPTANGSDLLGPWPVAVGWTPLNYSEFLSRARCWLKSDYLEGDLSKPTAASFTDGQQVLQWTDITGKGNNLYSGSLSDISGVNKPKPPRVALRGLSGRPTVQFNGADQSMATSTTISSLPVPVSAASRLLFPFFVGSKFTAFVAFRPTSEAQIGAIFSQFSPSPSNKRLALLANRAEGDSHVVSSGRISLFCDTTGTVDPAGGLGEQPNDFQLVDGSGRFDFCIATFRIGPATNDSITRFNGTETEAGFSSPSFGSGAFNTHVGRLDDFTFPYSGELMEIIVIPELLTLTDMQLFEGYLANYWGGQGRLLATHPYAVTPAATLLLPSKAPLAPGQADINQLNHRSTILAKFSPGGELKWTVVNYSGIGNDVIANAVGDLICLGEFDEVGYLPADRGKVGFLRRVLDLGDSAQPDDAVADHLQNRFGTASNSFDLSYWTKAGATVTPGATADPSGTTFGHSVADDAGGGAGTVSRSFTSAELQANKDYTFSVFVKRSTATTARVRIEQTTGATQVDINLVTNNAVATTTGSRRHSWNLKDFGNGWVRIEVSLDFQTSDSSSLLLSFAPDTADTALATFFWGAQLERGKFASDYFVFDSLQLKNKVIPTYAAGSYPRIGIDKFGNVFVPGPWPVLATPASNTLWTMRVFDKDLYLATSLDIGRVQDNTFKPSYAVAPNPDPPEYLTRLVGQSRNLLGYSEDFANAYWTKTSMLIAADTSPAPDGTITADTLDSTAAGGNVERVLSSEVDSGEPYTFSVFLRPAGGALTSALTIEHSVGSQSTSAVLAWNSGTNREPLVTKLSSGGGDHLVSLSPEKNGFFRISVTATHDSALGSLRVRLFPDSAVGTVSTWGAQLERGTTPSPYQRVLGRWAFAPPPASIVEPIGISDVAAIVGPALDVKGLTAGNNFHEVRQVDTVPSGLPARQTKIVSVVRGGFIVSDRFGAHRVPRGGSNLLSAEARYVSVVAAFQRVFAVDGTKAAVFEPAVDGQGRALVATRGSFPTGVQLISAWRNRLVMARTADNPFAWFMSAAGDPFDHDYFSPPITTDKATFDGLSRAGPSPDAINTILPFADNLLVLGCDHAIWVLDGDPLTGGRWSQLSDVAGILYGSRTWTKDPEGVVYFFGARGGFFMMSRDGIARSLTTETIERRLSDIDLDNFYVECFWNWRAEGVEIYVIPFDSRSTVVKHFFWGRRFDEWREDQHTLAGTQPSAGFVFDGDKASDRRLLYASYDNFIMRWDEAQKNDDVNAIDARERFGPFQPSESVEARYGNLIVQLSADSSSADFELYASDSPDSPGSALASGLLGPGRNEGQFSRVRGANFWLDLRNNRAGEGFAFERGTIMAALAGRARKR